MVALLSAKRRWYYTSNRIESLSDPKYTQGQEDQLLLGCDNAPKSDRLGYFDMTYSYCDTKKKCRRPLPSAQSSSLPMERVVHQADRIAWSLNETKRKETSGTKVRILEL